MYNGDEFESRGSTPRPPADSRVTIASLPSNNNKPSIRSQLTHQLSLLCVALKSINVEIVIFLVYAGWAFGNTLQAPGLYRRVCETYFEDSSSNCSHIDDPDVENTVQKHVAEWSIFNALAYLTPALVVDTILGAYGDKHGRQINILFGICGIAFSEYGFLLTLSETVHAPYFTTALFGLVAGMTGYIAMVPVSCNAYLTDITDNSDLLTIRAGVLTAAQSLATVVGGVIAAFSNLQIGIAVDIELLLYLFAFIYTLIRIPQTPGHKGSFVSPRSNTVMTSTSSCKKGGFVKFFCELKDLLKSGFKIYTRKRVGHRRAFMMICVLTLMITYTTATETMISPVMNSYVFRRQHNGLDWTTRELGLWNGIGYFTLFIGTLIFLPLFKRVFFLRETTIILIAIVSSAARCVIIAFSTKTWHMYIAQVAGIFSGMVQPAIVSFIVQLVPYEEIGRVFSLFGIGGDFAFIITYVVYDNIYRATVEWFPGFMFLFIAGLQLIVFGAMLWVHVQSVRERIGENTAITRATSRSQNRGRNISTVSRPEFHRRDFINDKRQSLFTYE